IWTRGLAWALYGFTAVHRLLPRSAGRGLEDEFLQTARRCAECYLRRSPPELVPPWDFDAPPQQPPLWDSSAAAIAASGLLGFSEEVNDAAERERYQTAARTLLTAPCSEHF